MLKSLPLLIALLVVVVAGYIHGKWTQRFEKSPELQQAAARLAAIPLNVGNWQAHPVPDIDPEELALAGAEGAWIKRFTSPNKESVLVVLLVGRAGNMSVHRPENCYPGAGYELGSASIRYPIRAANGDPLGECWTAKFVKKDVAAPSQLRIFWSWYGNGNWKASGFPRWDFRDLPYLYKLYVIRETSNRSEPLDAEPAVNFLQQFLPELSKALTPS